VIAWALALAAGLMIGPVMLRDGSRIEAERIDGFSDQGVRVAPSFDGSGVPTPALVPWADVLEIEGGWGEAEPYRLVARSVHRAEMRLARGDAGGVLRALGPITDTYLDSTGPTSGAMASALAIARLLRDDRAGATAAWLAWRAAPSGPTRAWIDPDTALAPGLPPVFTRRDARAFVASPPDLSDGPEHARALAEIYRAAAEAFAGTPPSNLEGPATRLRADPGVRLAWEIVRARADTDAAGRRAAREFLERRLRSGGPAWERAWARLGVGASMLAESDRTQADAGAAELIAVVLFHQDTAPGLSDLAAGLLIEYFEATDRPQHAEAVRAMDRAALSGLVPAVPAEPEDAPDPLPAEDLIEDAP
jgi:hypothetical protein